MTGFEVFSSPIILTLCAIGLVLLGMLLGLFVSKYPVKTLLQTQSELTLFDIINLSDVGYSITDKEARIVFASHSYLRLSGMEDSATVVGRRWMDLDDASDGLRKRREIMWYQIIEAGADWSGVVRWVLPNGERRYFETHLRKISDNRFALIHQDRTERIATRRALEEKDKLTDYILNNIPLVIALQKPDGTVVYSTDYIARRLGISVDEMIGRRPDQFEPFDRFDMLREMLLDTSKTRAAIKAEPIHFTKGPLKDTDWLLYITPIFADTGEVEQLLTVALEITEQVKLQKESSDFADKLADLQKAEALNQFAGGLAHELGNLLHPVGVYARALKENPDMSERKKLLERINTAVIAAGEILHKTSDITRPGNDNLLVVDIGLVVSDVVRFINGISKNIRPIQCETPSRPVLAQVSESGLRQVILNLLNNAVFATQERGSVRVRIAADISPNDVPETNGNIAAQYIRIDVADTGSGMDEATKLRIFEAFYTTKRDNKGTGLGLAFVKRLIANWQGSIEVYSVLEEGSTFSIWLPEIVSNTNMQS